MIDKYTFNRTVHFLRRNFTWSMEYKRVKKRCFIDKGIYKCEGCHRLLAISDQALSDFMVPGLVLDVGLESFAIDHVIPVGTVTSLDDAAAKIFCDESNLMGLWMTCHYFKTRVDLDEIKDKKKSLLDKISLGDV